MGVVPRVRAFVGSGFGLTPRGRLWLSRGVAAVGYVLLARVLLVQGIAGAGGGGGVDAIAYWTAGRTAAEGGALYSMAEGAFGAYAYPPPFAQLLAPLSVVPVVAFVWIWRAFEMACLRVAAGSWTRAGWVLLLPPVLSELDAGNVHLVMAAVCALAMRGHALPIGPTALLKLASLPLAPLGWVRDRRGLALGLAAGGIGVALSYLAAPEAWHDWLAFLGRSTIPSGMHNVAEALPLPVRVALAGAVGVAAVRWVRLAPFAVLLVYPVVWINALSTLVAVITPIPARAVERAPEPMATPVPRTWQEVVL